MGRALVGALVVMTAVGCRSKSGAGESPTPSATSVEAVRPAPSAAPIDPWPAAEQSCAEPEGSLVFVSPEAPRPGQTLRIMVVSETPVEQGEIAVRRPDGATGDLETAGRGGPPFSFYAEVPKAAVGTHRIILHAGSQGLVACRDVEISEAEPGRRKPGGGAWAVHRAWDRPMENLYSAWLEMLFDDPVEEQPAWPALHEVTRDARRNLLFNHLGLSEDDPTGLKMDPDCADLPYILRAYFSFKLGLPFSYSSCTRGGSGQPPTCRRRFDNLEPVESRRRRPIDIVNTFFRVHIKDTVHSGTGRTAAEDDATDYYPIALTPEAVRPGAVYADPYGHILVVVKRIAQTPDAAGILLAVDGQPDGTIARRRYWRGNFLFSLDEPEMGSPGFKRFRPVRLDGARTTVLDNAAIGADPVYGDYSLDQYTRGAEGFYDGMDDVLSPNPLDPERALLELIQALEEQVRGRVLSVQNGEDHVRSGAGTIDMPEGHAIFETTGAWENFSTPSRDLRMLIAIDVVAGFPELVARRPERFAMPAQKSPAEVVASLEALLATEFEKRSFAYRTSDDREHVLTLKDVLSRVEAFEMAYNPNDCIEKRWAAPEGSKELSSCRRHAPGDQRAKMRKYRPWFAERRRPVRR